MDKLIYYLHILVFLIGIYIPFSSNIILLVLYSIAIPFLFFHWATNNDTCALTILESYLSNTPKERTFMGRFLGKIFILPDDIIGFYTKALFFVLWLITQLRLIYIYIIKNKEGRFKSN